MGPYQSDWHEESQNENILTFSLVGTKLQIEKRVIEKVWLTLYKVSFWYSAQYIFVWEQLMFVKSCLLDNIFKLLYRGTSSNQNFSSLSIQNLFVIKNWSSTMSN